MFQHQIILINKKFIIINTKIMIKILLQLLTIMLIWQQELDLIIIQIPNMKTVTLTDIKMMIMTILL